MRGRKTEPKKKSMKRGREGGSDADPSKAKFCDFGSAHRWRRKRKRKKNCVSVYLCDWRTLVQLTDYY